MTKPKPNPKADMYKDMFEKMRDEYWAKCREVEILQSNLARAKQQAEETIHQLERDFKSMSRMADQWEERYIDLAKKVTHEKK